MSSLKSYKALMSAILASMSSCAIKVNPETITLDCTGRVGQNTPCLSFLMDSNNDAVSFRVDLHDKITAARKKTKDKKVEALLGRMDLVLLSATKIERDGKLLFYYQSIDIPADYILALQEMIDTYIFEKEVSSSSSSTVRQVSGCSPTSLIQ